MQTNEIKSNTILGKLNEEFKEQTVADSSNKLKIVEMPKLKVVEMPKVNKGPTSKFKLLGNIKMDHTFYKKGSIVELPKELQDKFSEIGILEEYYGS